MSQSQEINRLTKDLGRASELRNEATEAMRAATKSMLATCTTVRGELGHEYAAQTHKFLASLAKDVAAYRRAMAHQVAKTKKNVAADRQAMMSQIARWMGARSKASKLLHHDLDLVQRVLHQRDGRTLSRPHLLRQSGHRQGSEIHW